MSFDVETLFLTFERLGVIYISRNRDKMIFNDVNFLNNIGTFGGAITVNSPDFTNRDGPKPYVIVSQCHFSNNMAYFSGNAIYVKSYKKYT